MPRDSGGSYTLPAGNPVVPGTVIESTWANPTMNDLAAAMTDSLSRSGKGGMTFSLRGPDGSAAVPTFSFTNEPSTGRYRDGNGTVVEAVLGNPIVRYTAAGMEQWDGAQWIPLTPRDALGTPFDPAPTALTSTNVQDAIEEVFGTTGGTIFAINVVYDDSAVYFGAPTVQQAIDILGNDLSGVADDVLTNAGDIDVIEGEIDIIDGVLIGFDGRIGQNETDIQLNTDAITDHQGDYIVLRDRVTATENVNIVQDGDIDDLEFLTNQHTGLINDNAQDISDNVSDIDLLESYFTGGVCEVIHGGTGVTSKTGSGSVVLSSTPSITNAQLLGNPEAVDPPSNDNDFSVANTGWVQRELAGEWTFSSNANGHYLRNNRNGFKIQWGYMEGSSSNRVVPFPILFTDLSSIRVLGTDGMNRAPVSTYNPDTHIGVSVYALNQFEFAGGPDQRGHGIDYVWMALGE